MASAINAVRVNDDAFSLHTALRRQLWQTGYGEHSTFAGCGVVSRSALAWRCPPD
jgi:hypothetical protein